MFPKILGILSLLGRENRVIRSLCMIRKVFPYMSMRVDQAKPHRTHRLSSSLVQDSSSLRDPPLIRGGVAPVGFMTAPLALPSFEDFVGSMRSTVPWVPSAFIGFICSWASTSLPKIPYQYILIFNTPKVLLNSFIRWSLII